MAPTEPVARPAELTSRERRERALLAMCIALPEEGAEYLERLTERAPLGRPARGRASGCGGTSRTRSASLPHDDRELAAVVTELVMTARTEPASAEAMELNFMLLEQRRIEARIGEAGESGDYERGPS